MMNGPGFASLIAIVPWPESVDLAWVDLPWIKLRLSRCFGVGPSSSWLINFPLRLFVLCSKRGDLCERNAFGADATMNDLPQEEIDRLILSFAHEEYWRKVAMIISRVLSGRPDCGDEIIAQRVADRIVALVKAGRLEAQGNLNRWRHSEVRLSVRGLGGSGDASPEGPPFEGM
jgi:Protein of unknown function